MKKIFTLLMLSAMAYAGAMAQTSYAIKVNGVDITSDNAAAVTGSGIAGTVSYDAEKNVLTFNNATITATGANNALSSRNDGLTVKLVGKNALTSGNYSTICFFQKATITGNGTLSATSDNSTAIQVIDYSLDINGGCEVSASGIGGIAGMMGIETLNVNASKLTASGFVFGAISDINVNLTNCEIESGSYDGEDVSIVPVTDGIKQVEASNSTTEAPAYDLNGIRLSDIPANGLYIRNRKKIAVGKK